MLVLLVVIVLLRLRRKTRRLRKAITLPLAGYDTGCRSPWRAPPGTGFHRGF
jgi:hypothetical protein